MKRRLSGLLAITTFISCFLASAPVFAQAYFTNTGAGTVSVDSGSNGIPVGADPTGVAWAYVAGSRKVYVTNTGSDSVSVIDPVANTAIATITVGNHPFGVAATPDGKIYVTNLGSNTLSAINTATNKVIATIPVGDQPIGVAVAPTPKSLLLYVANSNDNNVSVIDTATDKVILGGMNAIPVGNYPYGVTAAQDGSVVYVVNQRSNNVTAIDPSSNTVLGDAIPIGDDPSFGVILPNIPQ
jgi:YVTN family beta-propeller protein